VVRARLAFGFVLASPAALAGEPTLLRDLVPGPSTVTWTNAPIGGALWLDQAGPFRRLWRLDPQTLEAQHVLDDTGYGWPRSSIELSGVTVMIVQRPGVSRGVVLRTDGTPTGTFEIGRGTGRAGTPCVRQIARLGEHVYILSTEDHRVTLTRTTGDGEDEVFVWPVEERGCNGPIAAAAGALWFSVQDDDVTYLYSSDGTRGGTRVVIPLEEAGDFEAAFAVRDAVLLEIDGGLRSIPSGSTAPHELVEDVAALTVASGFGWFLRGSGRELWRTDGTAGDTALFLALDPPVARLAVAADTLFAVATNHNVVALRGAPSAVDVGRCTELVTSAEAAWCARTWPKAQLLRIDAASLEVAEIDTATTSTRITRRPGGGVIVSRSTPVGPHLDAYREDGERVASATPFESPPPTRYYPEALLAELRDGTVLVQHRNHRSRLDLATGAEVWRAPGSSPTSIDDDGFYYFSVDDYRGVQLYRFDLDADNARLVRAWSGEIVGLLRRSRSDLAFYVEGTYLGEGGWWRSDGTLDGTRRVAPELTYASTIHDVAFANDGRLELLLRGETDHLELWRESGDEFTRFDLGPAPVIGIRQLVVRGDRRYVLGWRPQESVVDSVVVLELDLDRGAMDLRFEGPPGERFENVELIGDGIAHVGGHAVVIGEAGVTPVPLTGVEAVVPFAGGYLVVADREDTGVELWRWRPGQEPELVRDIAPGRASSAPRALSVHGDRAAFSAWHPELGREVFITDGTSEGTLPIGDVAPGRFSGVHASGDVLLGPRYLTFIGVDPEHGAEPWRIERDAIVAAPPPNASLEHERLDEGCACSAHPTKSSPWAFAALLLLSRRARRAPRRGARAPRDRRRRRPAPRPAVARDDR
jgi:ELWxxDGT repeat protein